MKILLILFVIQGFLGAFDTIYHHELTERLPWRKTASKELKLHGIRNFFYSLLFISLAWVSWNGLLAWAFVFMLLTEVFITLWDFVEEDQTRKLPSTERITHTILAINYGVILALLTPILMQWAREPTGFTTMNSGVLSWIMTFYAVAVFIWGWRDFLRGRAMSGKPAKPKLHIPVLSKSNQQILVSGGTGFIGRPLCQALIDQGHAVTVLTRSIQKSASLFRGRITLIESLDALNDFEHFDAVINLAGEPISQRWSEKSKLKMMDSRISITNELVKFMKRAAIKPSVFISSSAIGVYGTDKDTVFSEDTPPSNDATGAFPRDICQKWEDVAQEAKALGIRVCLLRTGVVLESDGGALAQMLLPFEFGLGGPMGSGNQWFSWIHRDDLVRLCVHIINESKTNGAVNATAPEPVTNKIFSRALGIAMRRPAIIPLPAFQVKLLFGKMGEALLLAGQKVIPEKALNSGFIFNYPTINKALGNIFLR